MSVIFEARMHELLQSFAASWHGWEPRREATQPRTGWVRRTGAVHFWCWMARSAAVHEDSWLNLGAGWKGAPAADAEPTRLGAWLGVYRDQVAMQQARAIGADRVESCTPNPLRRGLGGARQRADAEAATRLPRRQAALDAGLVCECVATIWNRNNLTWSLKSVPSVFLPIGIRHHRALGFSDALELGYAATHIV
jgi:hypothetical protein